MKSAGFHADFEGIVTLCFKTQAHRELVLPSRLEPHYGESWIRHCEALQVQVYIFDFSVSGHRLTPTLIAIVAMFMFLVTPSEILKFYLEPRPSVAVLSTGLQRIHHCSGQQWSSAYLFFIFLLDQCPFCGATDCPPFGLCVILHMSFNVRVVLSPALLLACTQ